MKLGYVIVYVPDVAATVAFYEAAFGLTRRFVHESGQYAEMETGGTALAFADEGFVSATVKSFRANRLSEAPSAAEIGLVTDNVAAVYKKAVSAGATDLVPPIQKPWGQTVSYVRDINGFLVEICDSISA